MLIVKTELCPWGETDRVEEIARCHGTFEWRFGCLTEAYRLIAIPLNGARVWAESKVMANVRKGQTVPSEEWWKHLRTSKRIFWKSQRSADRALIYRKKRELSGDRSNETDEFTTEKE